VSQQLGLESAHAIGAGALLLAGPAADDHPHRWVLRQPLCIVGILVSGQSAVDRSAQQGRHLVLNVAAGARLPHHPFGQPAQPKGLIQLPNRHQARIRGDLGPPELHMNASVEVHPQTAVSAFTH